MRGAAQRDEKFLRLSAIYTAFAYHDPKNIPQDAAQKPKKTEAQKEAERIRVRATLIAMSKNTGGADG